jgi:O-antigen ligase
MNRAVAAGRGDPIGATARASTMDRLAAIAAGLAVPALVSGRATMAVLCAVAFAGTLAAPGAWAAVRALGRAWRGLPGRAVMVLLGAWLVSTILSFDPWVSLQVWARMAVFVPGAVLLGLALAADRARLDLALRTLVAGSAVAAALALAGSTVWPDALAFAHGKAPGWNAHEAAAEVKGFGSALACLMPMVLWAGWHLGGLWRAAALAFQPLALVAMIVADSEAGLAGAALAGAVLAVATLWRAGALIPLVAIVVGGAAGAILAGLGPLADAFAAIDPHRAAIWRAALSYLPAAPVLGHGLDVINLLPGADALVAEFNQARIPSHPHDWAIEVLVESGVVGLGALLVALGALAWSFARAGAFAGAAGLALMAAFWGSGLVNFSVWAAWWQGVFLLLGALAMAGAAPAGRKP